MMATAARSAAGMFAALVLLAAPAYADELHTVSLDMNDGTFVPARLEVPAGVKFKIVIRNLGKTAAEFESLPLRKEKVLAPGAESFVVVHPLRAGEYGFFDDFHQEAQGVVVAK